MSKQPTSVWSDVTNYGHVRAGPGRPLCFELKAGWLTVEIQDYDGIWHLSCRPIGALFASTVPLLAKSPATAKQEALTFVIRELQNAAGLLGKVK